jgi:MSHA biogenesis protein MshI
VALFVSRPADPSWVSVVSSVAESGAVLRRFACVEPGHPPRVRWLETEPSADATQALRALRRRRALHRHRLVALLDRDQYQISQIEAPEVPRAEWRLALRWQLQDRLEFAVDKAAIDLLEIPSEEAPGRRPQLFAVAAAREAMLPVLEAALRADVRLEAVDVAETALRNLCGLLDQEGGAQALLHVDEQHSHLVITAQGELQLSRQMDIRLAELRQGGPLQRQHSFEHAGLDLQRTLDGFERSRPQLQLGRLLVAPGQALDDFLAYLRELVYMPVQALDASEPLDLSEVAELATDPLRLNAYLPAIGAALRGRSP